MQNNYKYISHGSSWTKIVNDISSHTGIIFSASDQFTDRANDKVAEDSKFVAVCPKCGYKFTYSRICKTVKAISLQQDSDKTYIWCSDCGKKDEKLILIKGKEFV